MVDESTKPYRTPLLPLRHEQGDFFVCDILDAVPKGDAASMEHPIFTLSTKPDTAKRRYDASDAKSFLEVIPSSIGLSTVHDRDVLIYCISQVMAALNAERQVSRTLRFKAIDMLLATNRKTDGRAYEQLKAALDRLAGTRLVTNITTGDKEQTRGFGLIDSYEIIRETREGRMLDLEVTLSDWTFNAIAGNEVLTLNKRYFQLRKPLERRIYELARKHCGQQAQWRCGLAKLKLKTGSNSSDKGFRRMVRSICEADRQHAHMPDYSFRLEPSANGEEEVLVVRARREMIDAYADDAAREIGDIKLKPDTYEKAKRAAPRWDIYHLEGEWRAWMTEPPRNADAAFIGFCKKWYERKGEP